MADITDTAISVTEAVGNAARLATKIGSTALPIVQFVAAFFPGAAPLVQVLSIAAPIIERIAIGAPIAVAAINQGRPIIEAIQTAGPQLLSSLKQLYAVAVNNDPARPETNLTADDVSDAEAATFAGPVLFGLAGPMKKPNAGMIERREARRHEIDYGRYRPCRIDCGGSYRIER